MKLKEKKLPDGKISLEAHATPKEVEGVLATAIMTFASNVGLQPEPGKTIAQLAEEKLGIKDLDAIVKDSAMEALIPFAIDKSGLMPAYPPKVIEVGDLRRGQEVTFKLEIMPKAPYELTSYEPVSITVPPFSLDEKLVDEQIEQLAQHSPQYVRSADQHEVRSGDSVLLKMESFENGKRMPGLCSPSRTYVTGKGFMPQGFDDGIIGMEPGETKTVVFEGPSVNTQGEEVMQAVESTVTVLEIQTECIPDINDAWVARNLPMYKDVEGLRAEIRAKLETSAREEYNTQCRREAASKLAERFDSRIPDEAYESMRDNLMRDLKMQIAAQGISFEDYMEQQGGEQQFKMMMIMQIRQTLVHGYALDALFAHEKMKLTEDDYLEGARELEPHADPLQTKRKLEKTGCKFILREAAERRKAADFLLEHADITVKG